MTDVDVGSGVLFGERRAEATAELKGEGTSGPTGDPSLVFAEAASNFIRMSAPEPRTIEADALAGRASRRAQPLQQLPPTTSALDCWSLELALHMN